MRNIVTGLLMILISVVVGALVIETVLSSAGTDNTFLLNALISVGVGIMMMVSVFPMIIGVIIISLEIKRILKL